MPTALQKDACAPVSVPNPRHPPLAKLRYDQLPRVFRDRWFPGEQAPLETLRSCAGDFPAPRPDQRTV